MIISKRIIDLNIEHKLVMSMYYDNQETIDFDDSISDEKLSIEVLKQYDNLSKLYHNIILDIISTSELTEVKELFLNTLDTLEHYNKHSYKSERLKRNIIILKEQFSVEQKNIDNKNFIIKYIEVLQLPLYVIDRDISSDCKDLEESEIRYYLAAAIEELDTYIIMYNNIIDKIESRVRVENAKSEAQRIKLVTEIHKRYSEYIKNHDSEFSIHELNKFSELSEKLEEMKLSKEHLDHYLSKNIEAYFIASNSYIICSVKDSSVMLSYQIKSFLNNMHRFNIF